MTFIFKFNQYLRSSYAPEKKETSFKYSVTPGGQIIHYTKILFLFPIVGGTLQLLDHFNTNLDEEPLAIYRYIEATKFAFAQRSKLGDWEDPDINQVVNETVQYIQSKKWLEWVLDRWNDTHTSMDTKVIHCFTE